MSLDIGACISTNSEKELKDKYGFTKEEVENFSFPSADDFFYRLHPSLLKGDKEFFNEITEKYEDIDHVLNNFHIGYGHFSKLRKDLGKMMGFTVIEEEEFPYGTQYDWSNVPFDDHENEAILDFFSHSDCDGKMSEEHVHFLSEAINKFKKLPNDSIDESGQDQIAKFLDFLDFSDKRRCYWVFE